MKKDEAFTHEGYEVLERIAMQGAWHAMLLVKTRFDDAKDPVERLPYHRVDHTISVVETTNSILKTIQNTAPHLVTKRDFIRGTLGSGFHDTAQYWEEKDGKRKRHSGSNEETSADEAQAFMESENERNGSELFSIDDVSVVREAIRGTIPTYDATLGTIVQKNITSESHVVARAVALADINIFGLEPERAVDESRRLFLEDNIDILEALRNGSVADSFGYKDRMTTWMRDQVAFTKARQIQFYKEINSFPLETQAALLKLFGGFPKAVSLLEAEAEACLSLSFTELAERFGYSELLSERSHGN